METIGRGVYDSIEVERKIVRERDRLVHEIAAARELLENNLNELQKAGEMIYESYAMYLSDLITCVTDDNRRDYLRHNYNIFNAIWMHFKVDVRNMLLRSMHHHADYYTQFVKGLVYVNERGELTKLIELNSEHTETFRALFFKTIYTQRVYEAKMDDFCDLDMKMFRLVQSAI
ncbi:hypothetical protein [Anaeromicropila populeti]|uniref:Uncharacterized protein n=1 Tax=Anaeromicropila populeti TaxID=37658 RepID=A0A1I6HK00_9FIRM|nr:hypothetical protein [Anaeromicropila populeti]SFR54771.1 hypothetical protein SAMN05661086_00049 [Anaeromicropila populeti]